ncbi:MAG: LuxR family transcriptional regulator, partial [Candidatus Arsenophonus phytopathogenicus]
MKTSDVLTSHLISFMEKQEDIWDIKDTESCFVYANKALLTSSCLSVNFNIEGRRTFECPVSWCEYADTTVEYEQIVVQSDKSIFFIVTHLAEKERTLQSVFVKKFPYYTQNKIAGTICHGRKISPRLLSEHFFKNPTTPSFLTNHPPNNLFTTEELNVLFFAMKLMS